MLAKNISEIINEFKIKHTDLTENEKKLLDYLEQILQKVLRFIPLTCDKDQHPLIFKYMGSAVFPEISIRFCYNTIIVSDEKSNGISIDIDNASNTPPDFFANQIRNLVARG